MMSGNNRVKLIGLDLDGTITQHRSCLEDENKNILDKLRARYSLLIVGAGGCDRIHQQMDGYPINIIGNYGMEISRYDSVNNELVINQRHIIKPNRSSVIERLKRIRERFGYTSYAGEMIEFHDTGMVTFPLLGTKACLEEKLAFDPTKEKRRSIYNFIVSYFPEYTVFIGGTSSFDLVPAPFNKRCALEEYCSENEIDMREVIYFGDDWGIGGSDSHIYASNIRFVIVEDYRVFRRAASFLL